MTYSYKDHPLKNSPLNDRRLLMWEKKFPGIGDQLGEIFDTQMPTPKEIAQWQLTWYETTPYRMEILDRPVSELLSPRGTADEIARLVNQLGIHYYFWVFWQDRTEDEGQPGDIPQVVITPTMSFYYEEHHVMFKMAW